MHRIDVPSATPDGLFTEGSPTGGIPATTVSGDWLNDLQENIMDVLTAGGVTATKGRAADLAEAITNMISGSIPAFTPVQQGGGAGMTADKVYLGYDGTEYLLAQVGGTALGRVVFQTQMEDRLSDLGDAIGSNTDAITALQQSQFGVGQTLQNVTGSRSAGVTYTNTTGRPIHVIIAFDPDGTSSVFTFMGQTLPFPDNSSEFIFAMIPSGGTYSLSTWGAANAMKWLELR